MRIGPAIVGYGETVPGLKPDCLCDGLEIGFAVRLGNVHRGRACISFSTLDDVDRAVLCELLDFAWKGHAE